MEYSPEFIVTILFGSGILITVLRISFKMGEFSNRLLNLEIRMDKLETKVEDGLRYINNKLDAWVLHTSNLQPPVQT